jgi:hypothetical protein
MMYWSSTTMEFPSHRVGYLQPPQYTHTRISTSIYTTHSVHNSQELDAVIDGLHVRRHAEVETRNALLRALQACLLTLLQRLHTVVTESVSE